jgi:hypothetical protein
MTSQIHGNVASRSGQHISERAVVASELAFERFCTVLAFDRSGVAQRSYRDSLLLLEASTRVTSSAQGQSSWLMLLGLKPGNTCDVISAVAEFMVDVAEVEASIHVSSSV